MTYVTHPAKWETRSADTTADPNMVEVRAALDSLTGTVESRIGAVETGMTEMRTRLDRAEAVGRRPGVAEQRQDNAGEIETRAFTNYVKKGREAMGADEVRSLVVSDSTSGGYLAPSQFLATLLKNQVEISPIRALATVTATSAGELVMPKMTSTSTAAWVSETGTRTASEPGFSQVTITAHEASVFIDCSQRLLEDSAVSIEAELSMMLGTEFGRLESVAMVSGDGVGKPRGIMAHPDLPTLKNGHVSTLNSDKLISLMYGVKAAYRARGSWLMNGSTIAAVRSLKSATTSEYLFRESFADGVPPTLLGRPVYEVPDMADIGSAALPILFGDIATAYRVVDRVGLSLLRDPYTVATSGLVRMHSRRRVGGDLVMPEAVKALVMSV